MMKIETQQKPQEYELNYLEETYLPNLKIFADEEQYNKLIKTYGEECKKIIDKRVHYYQIKGFEAEYRDLWLDKYKEKIRIWNGGFKKNKITRDEAMKEALELAGIDQTKVGLQIMSKFSPEPYAKQILQTNKFLFNKNKMFFRYDNVEKIWKRDAEDFLKKNIRIEILGTTEQSKRYVEEIISYIKDISYMNEDVEELPLNKIVFKNCIYDLKTKQIEEITDKYFITSKLNVELREGWREYPKIQKFLKEISNFDEWMILALKELIAYCFYRDYPYQKFFSLVGSGCNGKSTFLILVERILGKENISSENIHDLSEQRFSKASLFNKFANISSDENYTEISSTGTLKKLTGGDSILAEEKFKPSFNFKNHAKMISCANQLFPTSDKTHAFFRRLFIIHFKKIFNKSDIDTSIINKICTPEELSGLCWDCLNLLSEMYKKDNFTFESDPDIEKQKELYEQLSDPFSKFLKENTENDYSGNEFIYKWEFNQRLNQWLAERKARNMKVGEINSRMREIYTESQKGENKWRSWIGIKWKSHKLIENNKNNKNNTFLELPSRVGGGVENPVISVISVNNPLNQPIKPSEFLKKEELNKEEKEILEDFV